MNLFDIAKDGDFAELAEFLRSHQSNDAGDLANALSAAVWREDLKSVILLLGHGATANCRPSAYLPPLHCAVEQRNLQLIEALYQHGADINYPNENGYTPLHLSVDVEADTARQSGETPSCEVTKLLLKLGANSKAKDSSGTTPLTIAEEYEFSDAIEILKLADGQE